MPARVIAGQYFGLATPYHARSGPCGPINRHCHPTMPVSVHAGQLFGIATLSYRARSDQRGVTYRYRHPTKCIRVHAGQLRGTSALPCPSGSMRVNTPVLYPTTPDGRHCSFVNSYYTFPGISGIRFFLPTPAHPPTHSIPSTALFLVNNASSNPLARRSVPARLDF